MKFFALLVLLLVSLAAQAQEIWVLEPNFHHTHRSDIVELDGRFYLADYQALWVADAQDARPETFVVADTLAACEVGESRWFWDPMIAHDGAVYLAGSQICYGSRDTRTSPSLWRYRPGGSMEFVGALPHGVRYLTVVYGRFFARGRDDEVGSGVFEILPENGEYRAVVSADKGNLRSVSGPLAVLNGLIYFAGRDGEGVAHIWRYDPATEESQPVAAYDAYLYGSGYAPLVSFDGRLFFFARQGDASGLWALGPAEESATLISPFEYISEARGFLVHSGRLFFHLETNRLRVYDPRAETITAVGWPGARFGYTREVSDLLVFEVSGESHPNNMGYVYCLYDDHLRCLAADPNVSYSRGLPIVLGVAAWGPVCDDGECTYVPLDLDAFEPVPETPETPGRREFEPEFYGADSTDIVELDGRFYRADYQALWVADARDAIPEMWVVAERLLNQPIPDWEGGEAFKEPPLVHDGALYFVGFNWKDIHDGPALWRYRPDGQMEFVAEAPDEARDFTIVNGRFFARGFDEQHGHVVLELLPETGEYGIVASAGEGSPSMTPGPLTVVEGHIYFTGRGPEGAWRIWHYDPVTDEASPIDAPEPRRPGYGLGRLVYFDERLFFAALLEDTAEAEGGIWAFDLGTKSTMLVLPLSTEEVHKVRNIHVQDDRLFYDSLAGQLVYDPVTNTFTALD